MLLVWGCVRGRDVIGFGGVTEIYFFMFTTRIISALVIKIYFQAVSQDKHLIDGLDEAI